MACGGPVAALAKGDLLEEEGRDDSDAEQSGTRIRLAHEVLAGTWDALVSGRAELALGVSGEVPAGGGYAIRMLGLSSWAAWCTRL